LKLCYLYLSEANFQKNGVDNKVKAKFNSLLKFFPESVFFYVNSSEVSCKQTIIFNTSNSRLFKKEIDLKNKIKAIQDFISKNKNNYNYFILRYPFASIALLRLVKNFPNKIIFEHNTNETVELKLSAIKIKQKFPFSFKPSILKLHLYEIPKDIFFENYLKGKILSYVKAGICVTPEIEKLEKNHFKNYRTIHCSNGVNNLPEINIKSDENKKVLKGVFIAGTYAAWHGIERILKSFLSANSKEDFEIHFVGKVEEEHFKIVSDFFGRNIFIHQFMNSKELTEFMNNMDFAIGSCALHKVGLTQGSVLKVREYFANGLPVVIGHNDPYINSINNLKEFCLEFPSNDSLIDFKKINDFLQNLYLQYDNLNQKIQDEASKYLNWDVVLRNFLNVLNAEKNILEKIL